MSNQSPATKQEKRDQDVLLACVHNNCRSGATKLIFNNLAIRQCLALRAESTDTVPGSRINPNVATALKSIGLDASNEFPKRIADSMLANNPVVVMMGRADDSNSCPANDLQAAQDWELPDPANQPAGEVESAILEFKSRGAS